jgi:hypothetical protein
MGERPKPPHSFWGQDPSGYCGCEDCTAEEPTAEVDPVGTDPLVALGRVRSLHGVTHWCFDPDEQPVVYEPDTQWWPCPTLAAAGVSPPADVDPVGTDPLVEVNRVARVLMAEWERAEGKPVSASYVATFADMARVVIADRRAQHDAEKAEAVREALDEVERRVLAEIESARNDNAQVTVAALYIALRLVREARGAAPEAEERRAFEEDTGLIVNTSTGTVHKPDCEVVTRAARSGPWSAAWKGVAMSDTDKPCGFCKPDLKAARARVAR